MFEEGEIILRMLAAVIGVLLGFYWLLKADGAFLMIANLFVQWLQIKNVPEVLSAILSELRPGPFCLLRLELMLFAVI